MTIAMDICYYDLGVIKIKERLMVQHLRNFIDNDKDYQIALVSGIRRTGKTTILRQLQGYYPEAAYIDLSSAKDGYAEIENRFLFPENRPNLLLLDEITYLDNYELISQSLYDLPGKNYKIIMTGSSSAHVIKLSESKLGGGRSKLFRLPLLTFIEYLYFTDKIKSYDDYQSVKNEYFSDYLQLKGLEDTNANKLAVMFNDNYFQSFYNENLTSNLNTHIIYSKVKLGRDDLDSLLNLIAYKLSEACEYEKIIRPDAGKQEQFNLARQKIRLQLTKIDISDAIVSVSSGRVVKLATNDKGRILQYLLSSGLAYIQYIDNSPDFSPMNNGLSVGDILNILSNCKKESELIRLFDRLTINIVSPLFYTRLGGDIIKRANISLDFLLKDVLLGKMLELYMTGSLLNWSDNSILTSTKLLYPEIGEVDIYDKKNLVLLEAATHNKKSNEIHLSEYFKAGNYIRVCSSKDKDAFNGQYYQIPYAKLCCMIDTGDIFKLNRTVTSD